MTPPSTPTGTTPRRAPDDARHEAVAQVLSGARARRAARNPYAHTRAVNVAKVALPVLAAVVLALIAVWPLFTGGDAPLAIGPGGGELEMVDARYLGTDQTARPFEVRAQRVLQSGAGGSVVELVNPSAEITLEGGDWLSLTASRGVYDQQSGALSLEGGVTLFHDGGYEFITDAANLDTQKGVAWGNTPVRGQGPFGDIDAGGFRIVDDGNTIVFTGKARLRLVGADTGRPG